MNKLLESWIFLLKLESRKWNINYSRYKNLLCFNPSLRMILQTSSRDYSSNERTVVQDSNILFLYESLNEKSIFSFIQFMKSK